MTPDMTVTDNKRELSIFFVDNTHIDLMLPNEVINDLVAKIGEHGFRGMHSAYEDYQIAINWDKVKYFTIKV